MGVASFEPTHRVPAGGLATWDWPDPARPPGPHLHEGLLVRLLQRRGDWAQVLCSNGWSGWVDGRALLAIEPPSARPEPTPEPAPRPRRPLRRAVAALALAAGLALIGSGVLRLAQGARDLDMSGVTRPPTPSPVTSAPALDDAEIGEG